MDSSGQGYRGISTYNSVMNGNIKDFVETCYPELFFADQNHYTFWNNVDDNWLAAFLGVKYILSGNGEPDETKYKLLDQVGSLYIHENVLDAENAHFYTQDISEESLRELCTEETREELLGETIALEDGTEIGDVSEIQTLKSEAAEDSRTKFFCNAGCAAERFCCDRKHPCRSGWICTFYDPIREGLESHDRRRKSRTAPRRYRIPCM